MSLSGTCHDGEHVWSGRIDEPARAGQVCDCGRAKWGEPMTPTTRLSEAQARDLEVAALLCERWGLFTFGPNGARAHVPDGGSFVTLDPALLAALVQRLRAAADPLSPEARVRLLTDQLHDLAQRVATLESAKQAWAVGTAVALTAARARILAVYPAFVAAGYGSASMLTEQFQRALEAAFDGRPWSVHD